MKKRIFQLVFTATCFTALCLSQSTAQTNTVDVLPAWKAAIDSTPINMDVRGDLAIAVTQRFVYFFDKQSGAADSIPTPTGQILDAQILGNTRHVIVAYAVFADTALKCFIDELDIDTKRLVKTIELPLALKTYVNKNLKLQAKLCVSDDAQTVGCVVGVVPKGWPWSPLLHVIDWQASTIRSVESKIVEHCKMSSSGNDIVVYGWFLEEYFDSQGTRYQRVDRTEVYRNEVDTLRLIANIDGNYKPTEMFSFMHDSISVVTWPDFQSLSYGNTKRVSNLIAFLSDGLSYVKDAHKEYPAPFTIHDVLTGDTLVRFIDNSAESYDSAYFFERQKTLFAIAKSNTVVCFSFDSLPVGTSGASASIPDTIQQKTFIVLPEPQITPIGVKASFEYMSSDASVTDWVFYAETIGVKEMILRADVENGTELFDTLQTIVSGLNHDALAREYWSTGKNWPCGAHVSANHWWTVSCHPFFLARFDWYTHTFDVQRHPTAFNAFMVAIDNIGTIYGVNRTQTSHLYSRDVEYYSYRVDLWKKRIEADTELVSAFNYSEDTSPGRRKNLNTTKWLEGLGTLVTLSSYDHGYGYCTVRRLQDGSIVNYAAEYCNIAPTLWDYDYLNNRMLLFGLEDAPDPNFDVNKLSLRSESGLCNSIQYSGNHFTFSGDGQYIVNTYGVYDLQFNMITATRVFTYLFIPVPNSLYGLNFNQDTLYVWRLPDAVQVAKVVLHNVIRTLNASQSCNTLLVTFANGTVEMFNTSDLFPFLPVSVKNEQEKDRRSTLQCYPNPAIERTSIASDLLNSANAEVQIISMTGQIVFQAEHVDANGMFIWDLLSLSGSTVVSGAYTCIVSAGGRSAVCMLIVTAD